jgi:hypothetical protein
MYGQTQLCLYRFVKNMLLLHPKQNDINKVVFDHIFDIYILLCIVGTTGMHRIKIQSND